MKRSPKRAARVSVPVVQGIHVRARGAASPATQKLPGGSRLPLARRGFSLLEVVLALAILTATVAILGELIRSGLRNAQLARDLSKAELIAESVLYQIEAGALPHQAVERTPVDLEPGWYYSVENSSSGTQAPSGLLQLRVTVELTPDKKKRPTKFSVVRWLRDPALVLAQQAQQLSVLPTSSTSSGGTSSSTSSSTMGSGVF
jgi:prepilin-type N-terminal cleavage/methylation domain-containing protein